ncbi:glutaredoxin [Acrasis kona]|uniref:Glutaredoxin n=1 Tax=Acrasis kona TaxID=1008807 RepID=A0AAW2ZFK2_9EUKA
MYKRLFDKYATNMVSVVRSNSGGYLIPKVETFKKPDKLIEFFEKEACPFCRKVRETMSMLDIDALVKPCPRGGERFRKELIERGGKEMVPYLVDPNTNTVMYESEDIIRYLFNQYGEGEGNIPFPLNSGKYNTFNSRVATTLRIFPLYQGFIHEVSRHVEIPLVLYNYEANPECRRVREALSTFEIPYHMINVAPVKNVMSLIPILGVSENAVGLIKSPKRIKVEQEIPGFQVPYLKDPNNSKEFKGADDIIQHIEDVYHFK